MIQSAEVVTLHFWNQRLEQGWIVIIISLIIIDGTAAVVILILLQHHIVKRGEYENNEGRNNDWDEQLAIDQNDVNSEQDQIVERLPVRDDQLGRIEDAGVPNLQVDEGQRDYHQGDHAVYSGVAASLHFAEHLQEVLAHLVEVTHQVHI